MDSKTLYGEIKALEAAYPALRRGSLGTSLLGRDIPLLALGQGERAVLYVGAHHGMEHVTAAVLTAFMKDYLRRTAAGGKVYEYNTAYHAAHRRIYLVPMLNPDGVEYAVHGVGAENPLKERVLRMNGAAGEDLSHWQANARGVDLNHNYDAGFYEYKEKEAQNGIFGGAPTRYSGEHPESEPETAALCRFLRAHEEIEGVLTLHTQGEEIYCNCAEALSAKSLAVGRTLQRLTGYRLADPTGLAAYGGLTDWCIHALRRPAYTLECGKGENPLPESQAARIFEKIGRALWTFPFLL